MIAACLFLTYAQNYTIEKDVRITATLKGGVTTNEAYVHSIGIADASCIHFQEDSHAARS